MSTVLIQRVIEVYDSGDMPLCAYIAQISVPHTKLLDTTTTIRVGDIHGVLIRNEAVFNQFTSQFTYIYTLIPDVIKSSVDVIDDNRIRFVLLNTFEGWTINLMPEYSEYLDISCDLATEQTHSWDGKNLLRAGSAG